MSKHEDLDFSTESGPPVIIRVELDGVEYEIRAGLAVLKVLPTENVNEEGLPEFDVQAGLAIDVKVKEGGTNGD